MQNEETILASGIFLALLLSFPAYGQSFVFGVKPNLNIQSAYFGLQFGALRPGIGLDMLRLSVNGSSSVSNYERDFNTGELYLSHEGEMDAEGSARLFIPHIGVQYHFSPQTKLRPYGFGSIFKSLASISVEGEETDRYYNSNGMLIDEETTDFQLDPEAENFIKELLGFWGFNVGFGVEFELDEHFSIGGEYTLRWLFASGESDGADSVDFDGDGMDDFRDEWQNEISTTFQMSYAAVVLNFHF